MSCERNKDQICQAVGPQQGFTGPSGNNVATAVWSQETNKIPIRHYASRDLEMWRCDSPVYTDPAGVIDYEANELGNTDVLETASLALGVPRDRVVPTLANLYRGWRAIWVTTTREAAQRYGDPESWMIPAGSFTLADDGADEGLLWLCPPHRKEHS